MMAKPKTCSECPVVDKRSVHDKVFCQRFNWLIDKDLAKKTCVCQGIEEMEEVGVLGKGT
jgi:hypothetical protein